MQDSQKLFNNLNNKNTSDISKLFLLDELWITDAPYFNDNDNMKLYKFKGKYYKPYIEKMQKLLKTCQSKGGKLMTDDGKIFYNPNNPDDTSSIVGKFMYEVNKIIKDLMEKYEDMEDSYADLYLYGNTYNEQLNNTVNDLEKISEDLKNYKTNFLDKIEYYIKLSKGFGHILVMVYSCILCFTSILGIVFLMVYTCLKFQGNFYILMHITWNLIRFFNISFLMYGAAFGMLYLGLRDAIGYNMFLFGETNLTNDTNTYLLPNADSKEFLRFCLNEKITDYTSKLDNLLFNDLSDFFSNYDKLNYLLKNNNSLDLYYSQNFNLHTDNNRIRNLEEIDTSISSEEEESLDSIYEDFSEFSVTDQLDNQNKTEYILGLAFEEQNEMINEINNTYINLVKSLDINNIAKREGNTMNSFDCGFLKNDLSMVYNTLYDLSVESRILCALSCCIGFFGEIVANFYILVMYHYDNNEFKEGNLDMSRSRNIFNKRNYDVSSRNEFLDKTKPANMKKFNKELDFEFS